jgi:hypothetical protein
VVEVENVIETARAREKTIFQPWGAMCECSAFSNAAERKNSSYLMFPKSTADEILYGSKRRIRFFQWIPGREDESFQQSMPCFILFQVTR